MASAPERLFVSLPLPNSCRAAVMGLSELLEGDTWTRPEQLHLTMRFLGNVESELASQIETTLAEVRVKPFLLPLEGVGRFPPRGPAKVLPVGIGVEIRCFFNSAKN